MAVITSPSGAAYHDIHNVLTRRARSVSILLIPALVQGEGAADSIRRAVAMLNKYNSTLEPAERVDVVIVGRGGGSAEDLWAFNDEALARGIRASQIPVISAVGHEIDWTICDWVSDLRAATPSAAAELVAQREDDLIQAFDARAGQIASLLDNKLLQSSAAADQAFETLEKWVSTKLQTAKDDFAAIRSKLSPAVLTARSGRLASRIDLADQRRTNAIESLLRRHAERLGLQMAKLDAMSPLAVLSRGYSITQKVDGNVVRDPADVKPGDKLKIRLERGKLDAEVLAS